MSIYTERYSKREINFALPVSLDASNEAIIVGNVGDVELDIEIYSGEFSRPLGTTQPINMRMDIEELVVPVTDGTLLVRDVDFLSADRDRSNANGYLIANFDLLKDATVDRTGARNIARTEGIASKVITTYNGTLDFKYRLKKNTSYIFRVTTIDGAIVSDILATMRGMIRELNTDFK